MSFLIRGIVVGFGLGGVAAIAAVKWHFRKESKAFHNPLEILGMVFVFAAMLCDATLTIVEGPLWPLPFPSVMEVVLAIAGLYAFTNNYAKATAKGEEAAPQPPITLVSSSGKSSKSSDA